MSDPTWNVTDPRVRRAALNETIEELSAPDVHPGRRIRHWRGRRGMSENELAEKAGMAGPSLHHFEVGRSETCKFLPQLCEALGINHEWALNGRGMPERGDPAAACPPNIAAALAALDLARAVLAQMPGEWRTELAALDTTAARLRDLI